MADQQTNRVSGVWDRVVSSPDAIWFLLTVYTFAIYELLGFEITVIMTLLFILRAVMWGWENGQ